MDYAWGLYDIPPGCAMNGRKLRVLVVDDQSEHRKFFSQTLSARGYACDVASSGQEGLAKLTQQQYDVVFLDLVLPEIDGEAILSWLRTRMPKTSVVISSAQDDEEIMRTMLMSGATAYLVKPLTADQLYKVMNGIENRRTAAGLDLIHSDSGA